MLNDPFFDPGFDRNDPTHWEARFNGWRRVIEKRIKDRGGSLAALDALGQEPLPAWYEFPGKKPIPGAQMRHWARYDIYMALHSREAARDACDSALRIRPRRRGVRRPCYLDRELSAYLVCTMNWRAKAASLLAQAEQGIRQALKSTLRGKPAAANKPIGTLKEIAPLIRKISVAIDENEPAFGRTYARVRLPDSAADTLEGVVAFLKQFEPTKSPLYFNFLGVDQQGEARALGAQSAVGLTTIVLHELLRGDMPEQEIVKRMIGLCDRGLSRAA